MKKKFQHAKTFVAGIISENPVFVALLGMCPTLATTKSVEAALGMGILVILTLLGSNLLISLLRKIIPAEVKIPCYIIIIATFVTVIEMATQAFVPDLYNTLGVFISLIVVNCIVLGRAEAFASKNGPIASIFDALGQGIGFTMAICIIALIREVFGTGAISFGYYFPIGVKVVFQFIPTSYTISLFVQSAGGFLSLGLVLAVMAAYKNSKQDKEEAKKKAEIEALKVKKAQELKAKAEAEAKVDVKKEEAPQEEKEVK